MCELCEAEKRTREKMSETGDQLVLFTPDGVQVVAVGADGALRVDQNASAETLRACSGIIGQTLADVRTSAAQLQKQERLLLLALGAVASRAEVLMPGGEAEADKPASTVEPNQRPAKA